MVCAKRLAGHKFGDLKVKGEPVFQGGQPFWLCRCWYDEWRLAEEKCLEQGSITCCIACDAKRKMEKTDGLVIIPYNTDVHVV